MNRSPSIARYTRTAVVLHWLIAALVSSTLLFGMELAKVVLRRVRPDPYVALAKRRAVMHGRAATTPT